MRPYNPAFFLHDYADPPSARADGTTDESSRSNPYLSADIGVEPVDLWDGKTVDGGTI